MRALVTGGAGFVGRHLGEHLEAMGDEVTSVDLEVDVADADAIGRAVADASPEAIYHLAAMTHVGDSWEFPAEVLRVNVLGTAGVLGAARASKDRPLTLVVSSAEVYGSVTPEDLPIDEGAPVAPLSPYAASKAAAEQMALQAWRGWAQPVIVVRPFNHVGPGQSPAFAVSALAKRIVEAQRTGAPSISVGTLSARRDYTDVRDVVRAYRSLVTGGTPGRIYNVCSGRDVAVSEVAARLCELAGADLRLVTDPSLVRPVEVPVMTGDGRRLSADTGWKPEIALDETLRDVLAYWRTQAT
ncbi:MAG: GDP-mannose 4,6-dehydratase [Acidimicrobiales bacterium]